MERPNTSQLHDSSLHCCPDKHPPPRAQITNIQTRTISYKSTFISTGPEIFKLQMIMSQFSHIFINNMQQTNTIHMCMCLLYIYMLQFVTGIISASQNVALLCYSNSGPVCCLQWQCCCDPPPVRDLSLSSYPESSYSPHSSIQNLQKRRFTRK